MEFLEQQVVQRQPGTVRQENNQANAYSLPPSPAAPEMGRENGGNALHAHQQPALTLLAIPAQASPPTLYDIAKRTLDLTVSIVALILSFPIILLLAALVRLDSPGPMFFRQVRVGQNGRAFTLYKFRTMYVDARQRFPELYAYKYSDDEIKTMYFKVLRDPRLTRFGQHLRKTSLDELPNLINVLRGEISLVGPRPEIPEMLPYYEPDELVKFSVKPGVTGLAQVTGRSVLRFKQTNAADVEYCRRRSFWFDLSILVRTIRTVFLRVGAF